MDGLGIQPKQFRYTLIVAEGTQTTDYVLPNAPIGWEESLIKWARSPEYYGMIRSFTVPLKFVLDGAWILRTQFYNHGLSSSVKIKIEEVDLSTWAYSLVFEGEIDFSTFSDGIDQVTATIMEGGLSAMIKSYENVKYTIPLDVADAIDLEITPLKLQERAQWTFTPSTSRELYSIAGLQWVNQNYSPQSNQLDRPPQDSPFTILSRDATSSPFQTSITGKQFYTANLDGDIVLSGNVKGSIHNNSGASATYVMIVYRSSDNSVVGTILSHAMSGASTFAFDQDFSITVSMLVGEMLWITTGFSTIPSGDFTNAGWDIDTVTDTTKNVLNATYFVGSPATTAKAIRPKYLFGQLIKKMNADVAFPVQSSLLDTWENLLITSGNAIRGLSDPTLITSFKDFFQSINSVLNCGFAIQSGKAVLEAKSYFFNPLFPPAIIAGEVKDFNLDVYEPYIYNSLKIGYEDQKFTTIINNLDEVNSTQVYSFPIVRIQKELNLISVYRADAYGIEDARITPVDSSNNNQNNDVFMIKAIEYDPGLYRPERTEGYISLTGVLAAETYYNWDLSPHRNLLRHGDFLHSILDKFNTYINFESALKNAKMDVVDLAGVRTIEDSNINIQTLPDKIFLPYLMTITTKLPKNMLTVIDAFPNGYIRSEYLDSNQDGYIIDASVDISKNSERELKLLLTPANLLLNLIH